MLPGFTMRWMKVCGALAPVRSTFCLSRTGLWSAFSQCTTSWHPGITRPFSNWSTSSLEIWCVGESNSMLITNMVLETIMVICYYWGMLMSNSQWGQWVVLFSSLLLWPVHLQKCPEWFHCGRIWHEMWLLDWQNGNSALSQPAVRFHQ